MAIKQIKRSGSKYKYVCYYTVNDYEYWSITIKGVVKKTYKSELEAAKAVDLILIRQGKEPVNILKRM